jgi:formate--tetrahydrofolate ligase
MKKIKPIGEVAKKIGLNTGKLIHYGQYKAKVPWTIINELSKRPDGKLILVTAVTPTTAGEGKTTTTIGLGQAFFRMRKKSIICLREPSLGPCFGIKGGAIGGGKAKVYPPEDINLHFTGDIHAVGTAHNLLAAMVDNSIYHGNRLNIDENNVSWRRVVDINDRALRSIRIDIGKGKKRDAGFDITVASEVMAILCLSLSLKELKQRLGKIIIGSSLKGKPVSADDLSATGSMTVLLKEALNPNLVQTTEGSPAFVHGGPFANIAHGCSSLMATKIALKLTDYVVTEAGFGADLGAEKFFDIKCRFGNLKPAAVVVVATVRALKLNGNGYLEAGLENLGKHLENMAKFGLMPVVAVNRFPNDSKKDLKTIEDYCQKKRAEVALSEVYAKGGRGGMALAAKVLKACQKPNQFHYFYELDLSPDKVIEKIAKEIYGADGVVFSQKAQEDLEKYRQWGLGNKPVCIAKTQYSLSDNPKLLGRPTGFKIHVNEVRLSNGADFYVAVTGEIMTMPGLPRVPAAEKIDVDNEGNIVGMR